MVRLGEMRRFGYGQSGPLYMAKSHNMLLKCHHFNAIKKQPESELPFAVSSWVRNQHVTVLAGVDQSETEVCCVVIIIKTEHSTSSCHSQLLL